MSAYSGGDADAFEALFERHRRPLFQFLVHQTGSRQLAEDLFQDVFFRIIRARKGYVVEGSFESWLFAIARNTLADQRRRSEVRSVVRSASTAETGSGEQGHTSPIERMVSRDPQTDPLLVIEASALRERLREALRKLPESQREVFLLRKNTGLNFERIADITDCGVATAKSRMRYAVIHLRRLLSSDPAGVPS